ncbi:FKBP-type peptidyl-prolyl cis-trans isomerase [Marinoscillum sp. MHG1-6]|uniref:FKBP-type peptidyl-prolyl cis-trans isomerase n=1 Tax=Marinoscillum sp. MHG1-6 TaxID=2959627 RepID=UPI00215708B3|nr:FKBP-type peptidyl-prolyl cis-trans isomerase [Marinoscillum sp. MHG1-6]
MKGAVFYVFVLILVLSVACGDSAGPDINTSEDSTIVAYLDSQNVTYSVDANGIYSYVITANASGKTQAEGNVLSIYYEMSVLNGGNLISYDSTDGDPIRFKQGAGAVYPVGVDLAVTSMKEGETWGFVIPSAQAFGEDYSSSLIPVNSTILFEATLVKIQSESDVQFEENVLIQEYADSVNLADTVANPLNQPENLTNGILYKRLQAGNTGLKPLSGDTVAITYTTYYPYGKSEPIDVQYAGSANPFTYIYGTGEVIAGLDAGVGKMELGDKALVILPSAQAYRESAIVFPDYLTPDLAELSIVPSYASKVGPYEVLIFEVTLLQIN